MPQIVTFRAPGQVVLEECAPEPLRPGCARVRTWYSGISAGTELTAYRGSNPYLARTWEPESRLFVEGTPTFAYPVRGWGYSEVGEVVEVADDATGVRPGAVVFGIWGHRSDAVVPVATLREHELVRERPVLGVFARVGAIALNAVLAADTHLGDRIAVFGQGVIGLLATGLVVASGADAIAVDGSPRRLAVARSCGAQQTVDAAVAGGAGAAVRRWSPGGADAAIELSGNVRALHEAIRSVVVDGLVVASGFYQGSAEGLRLGEEFHHNRVRIVASQISGTPVGLGARWTQSRLVTVFMNQVAAGRVDPAPLVSDVVPAAEVSAAFERLDAADPDTLQVVLAFDPAESR